MCSLTALHGHLDIKRTNDLHVINFELILLVLFIYVFQDARCRDDEEWKSFARGFPMSYVGGNLKT